MATKVKQIEGQIHKKSRSLHHIEALIAALKNPSEWEYRGELIDSGPGSTASCACGHPIRYIFVIHHPVYGTSQVGSTCIEHFKLINPALYEALKAADHGLQEQLNAAKRAAREAEQRANIETLKGAYVAIRAEIIGMAEKYIDNFQFRSIYRVEFLRGYPKQAPEYQKTGLIVKWYEKHLIGIKDIQLRLQVVADGSPRYIAEWKDLQRLTGHSLAELIHDNRELILKVTDLPINFFSWRTDTNRVKWLAEHGYLVPVKGESWFMELGRKHES